MKGKLKEFADAYLADPELNGTRAYMAVYPSANTDSARANAARALAREDVSEYIKSKMEIRQERTHVTQDWVVKELAKIAGFDPRKLFDDQGGVKPVSEWDDITAASISDFQAAELFAGEGEDRQAIGLVKKINTRDKVKALELLGKHLGMFIERKEITGKDGGPLQHQVTNMSDDDLTRVIKEWSK